MGEVRAGEAAGVRLAARVRPPPVLYQTLRGREAPETKRTLDRAGATTVRSAKGHCMQARVPSRPAACRCGPDFWRRAAGASLYGRAGERDETSLPGHKRPPSGRQARPRACAASRHRRPQPPARSVPDQPPACRDNAALHASHSRDRALQALYILALTRPSSQQIKRSFVFYGALRCKSLPLGSKGKATWRLSPGPAGRRRATSAPSK
jgi:hypothetical protein